MPGRGAGAGYRDARASVRFVFTAAYGNRGSRFYTTAREEFSGRLNRRPGICAAPAGARPANGNVGGRPAAYTERTLKAARPPHTAFGARSPAYRGPGAETPPGMARNACPLRPDMGALRDHHPPKSGFVDAGDTIMRLWRSPGSKANIISAWSAVALLESGVSARPRTSPRRWRRCGRAR